MTSRRLYVLIGLLALASSLSVSRGGTQISGAPSRRQPNGCPASSGLSEKEWVCFTLAEESERQEKEAKVDGEIERLRRDRRFGRLWASVGAEYVPNAAADARPWQPYGIGGVRLGRVDLWTGFFGGDAAVGVGVRF